MPRLIHKTLTITDEKTGQTWTEQVLDFDAYWQVDFEGNLNPDGSYLYEKSRYPTAADAKKQRELERAANTTWQNEAQEKAKALRKARKQANKPPQQ